MSTPIRIERRPGAELGEYVNDVARLRIEVFRDFPYLYDGDMGYERNYLQAYVQCPESIVVLALAGDDVVGASTAIPLEYETDDFKRPFVEHGYDLTNVFYCGESVLKAQYRGRGLGVKFFEEREAHARRLGRFDYASFCAVQRPQDHPLRPPAYVPLDRFWNKRGYIRHPELQATFRWKEIDRPEPTGKKMVFWLKRLARNER